MGCLPGTRTNSIIGLDVREGDPAQALHRHDSLDRLLHQREELTHAGVIKQRLLGIDQELVKVKPPGAISGTQVEIR